MDDKENIAEGLQVPHFDSSPPKKQPHRKTRSKSIGPGGLDEAPLKEDAGNRRKSLYMPAGILPSKEDEKKRREARRKSLANRRVSFAPEATLHTWDVIEYVDNATASSSSSSASRRASASSQAPKSKSPQPQSTTPAQTSDSEPPSTPPEQLDEPSAKQSPVHQRDAHQKKRRRSSGIPPMNFNNPEDVFSSSPANESSDSEGEERIEETPKQQGIDHTSVSDGSGDSTGSSARLEEALRQAATQAGTRGIGYDENGDMSMELADDEVTAAFQPWVQKSMGAARQPRDLTAAFDQENVNPFSPSRRPNVSTGLSAKFAAATDSDDEDDMSMDITHAMGGIIPSKRPEPSDEGEMTMDVTTAFGGIQTYKAPQSDRRSTLKRRRSSIVPQQGATAEGSPAKRQARCSSAGKQTSSDETLMGDQTMELTMAVGGIQQNVSRLETVERRRSVETSLGDETMDLTIAAGSIKSNKPSEEDTEEDDMGDNYEELSMEFTAVLGGIQKPASPAVSHKSPTKAASNPLKQTTSPSKKSPGRPRASLSSPSKPLRAGPSPSPRRTPRKSLLSLPPTTPDDHQSDPSHVENVSTPKPVDSRQATQGTVQTPTPKSVRFQKGLVSTENTSTPSKGILKSPAAIENTGDTKEPDELQEEPTLRSTAALFSSIKALSTPRKQIQPSSANRTTPRKAAMPKKEEEPQKTPSPKKRTPRKSISPRKQVRIEEVAPADEPEPESTGAEPDANRIRLQDFLDMTNIRFMDLTTTKRRHTAAPSAFLNKRASRDLGEQDEKPSLASCVAAAACVVPEYEMYQHACHELKRYISGGKDVVRQIEADVQEENPPLFSEFLSAPPDQRYVMSNQLKNMKTFSRLKSKEGWYGWRSNLLHDLKSALVKTKVELGRDEISLQQQEELLDATWPQLSTYHAELQTEQKQLQQRAAELLSCDREELEAARERLLDVESELDTKKRLLAQFKEQLKHAEEGVELVKERKIDCVSEIQEAERVREECRGWSSSEVSGLKARVTNLEKKYGWAITSASTDPSPSLTMTYASDLELYFHPLSFSPKATGHENSSISLSYVGDRGTPTPRPLTTSKRFFLQIIRAHLQCLPQSATTIPQLLATVKYVWQTALAVAEGIRSLEMECITSESILSDDRMAVSTSLIIPSLKTKVRATFEVKVNSIAPSVRTTVEVKTEVVYGVRYKETTMVTMAEYLNKFVGQSVRAQSDMGIWGDAIRDLKARLIVNGTKGEKA